MTATAKKMENREIERILGQQYAQLLKESRATSVRRDCEEIVRGSLNLLEHYNKISMSLQGRRYKGALT